MGEKKEKKVKVFFHRQHWSQFKPLAKINLFCKTNICEKHPLLAKTSQELRMLSSVTLDCQVTKIVMNSGSQL